MIRIAALTLFLGLCLTNPAWTQQQGSVEINTDSNVRQALSAHAQLMTEYPGMDGFRIQIFFDSGNTSKQAATNAKRTFETRFPDIAAYLSFEEPNYKVRVGNFRTRLDAEGCLKKIATHYPSAFVVPDFIEFPKIEE
ncbi:MAG: SPOR domain-containing protein [Bacteroidales bacterium]|nr:SPOR domain-containing protein [Bacteroidales bacterium]